MTDAQHPPPPAPPHASFDTPFEQLRAIAEVSRAIVSELDLDNLLQLVANLLHERFGYPFVHIFVVHPGRCWIEFKAGVGLYATHIRRELSFDLHDDSGIIPWVARTGQAALVNNVHADSHFRPLSPPGIDIKSELTVPLSFGDEVLGVFDIESESFDAFTADDLWLLETLAANIAIALRNAILFRSERWRRQAADSLREIAGVVRAKETLDNTLKAILQQLNVILPMTFAAIWLKTDDGFRFKIGCGLKADPPPTTVTHPWFDDIVAADAALVRRPEDPPSPLAEQFPPTHSAVGAALTVDEDVLGVLVLAHRQANRFGHEARRLLEIFAGQAAVVIQNTELYHKAQQQAWVSTALLQVAEATRNLRGLNEILAAVTRISPIIAGVRATAIWLKPPAAEVFQCVAAYGFGPAQQTVLEGAPLSAQTLLVIRLAILKQPVVVSPQNADVRLPPELAPLFGGQNLLFLPLLSQGDLNGLMMMLLRPEQIFSTEHLRILSGIAHQTASAIQTAQLVEARQAEAWVSTALLQVAQVVALQSDLSEVLDTVARLTPMLTGVSQCLVFVYNGVECTLSALRGFRLPGLPLTMDLRDFAPLQAALTDGQPHPLQQLVDLPPVLRPYFSAPRFQGIILPLNVKGSVVGALMVVDQQPPAHSALAARRRDILTGIAYHIALAIDNARLYAERARQQQFERELQLAREIQASFIPDELPAPPGWELASFWRMAREVGGDFFDIIPLSGQRLLIIIADVADKGLPAALFMARTSSLVRAVALDLDQPAQILARVNQLLAESARQGMFVTAFCAVLYLENGRLDYASAGHNPPIVVRQSTRTETLRANGIVLAVLDTADFEQKSAQLEPGDGVLFYTDGVTEAFNAQDDMFGAERLLAALRANWSMAAVALVDSLYQTVFDFTRPHPQSDDFTLLLLKRKRNQ